MFISCKWFIKTKFGMLCGSRQVSTCSSCQTACFTAVLDERASNHLETVSCSAAVVVTLLFALRAADINLLKLPDNLPDEKVVFLSDILPTAWCSPGLKECSMLKNSLLVQELRWKPALMSASNACCIKLPAHLPDKKVKFLSGHPVSLLVLPWLSVAIAHLVTRILTKSHACTPTRHVAARARCTLSTWKSEVCCRSAPGLWFAPGLRRPDFIRSG